MAMAAERKTSAVAARATREESKRSAKRKPTVSIIGAGRLGTALAIALAKCGYRIEAVVSRRLSSARRAARAINSNPVALSVSRLDELPPGDILLITTPDDAINRVAAALASVAQKGLKGRTALHASGALSSGELKPLGKVGFQTGSMHPLVSVSDAVAGAESFRRAFFCVEGTRRAVGTARALISDLGGQAFSIGTRDKALYHAAAVVASGHTVALFDVACEMLEHCGLTRRRARFVLLPLVRSTLENLEARETASALTGTFARADVQTVREHLGALGSKDLSAALEVYVLLGLRSIELAARRGADGSKLREIERYLTEAKEKR